MADIKIYGTLVRDVEADKIVKGKQVEGGYFVCDTLPTTGDWELGQLCYCRGDGKFHQYIGSTWIEANLGGGTVEEGTAGLGYNGSESGSGYRCDHLTHVSSGVTDIIVPSTYGSSRVVAVDFSRDSKRTTVTSLKISDGVAINTSCMTDAINLENVIIGDDIGNIPNNAFYNCTNLKHVTIGKDVTQIGDYAFAGCTSLTSIVLPDKLVTIGASAFKGCSNLNSIHIPKSVLTFGANAFSECKKCRIFLEHVGGPGITYGSNWNSNTKSTYYAQPIIPNTAKSRHVATADFAEYTHTADYATNADNATNATNATIATNAKGDLKAWINLLVEYCHYKEGEEHSGYNFPITTYTYSLPLNKMVASTFMQQEGYFGSWTVSFDDLDIPSYAGINPSSIKATKDSTANINTLYASANNESRNLSIVGYHNESGGKFSGTVKYSLMPTKIT